MNLDRLSRITDLFLEGKELHFGDDDTGKPILVWVNKLNSFEDEEARRDGSAARSMRLLALNDENPEIMSAREELAEFTRAELVEIIAAQSFDEDYLLAIDDVEADDDWADNLEALRMSLLLKDSDIPEDDPRWAQSSELNQKYVVTINELTAKRQTDRQNEYSRMDLDELMDQFIKNWKARVGLGEFFAEQRITQLFYALRDCQATAKPDGGWDHSKCRHERLLQERSQVRGLPEDLLERGIETLGEITVDRRTAGNSDVPTNSSESSGQQKQEEESTPSIPKVMPRGARAI